MIEEPTIEAPKTDFYLRLNAEADMPTALTAFYQQDTVTETDPETGEETVTNVGDPYLATHGPGYDIGIVGIIMDPTGNMLTGEDGMEYPEMAPLPGWHINIRIAGDARRADVEALDALYGVTPASPRRVWL